jgi:hypothetical protein
MRTILSEAARLMMGVPPAPKPAPRPALAVFNPGTGSAPQALIDKSHLILDIIGWTATTACVAGVLITAIMMAISHHRGMGSEHFGNLGKVMAACVLVGTAGPIVQWLV